MKLEHLPDANIGGSGNDLVRLFDFTAKEVLRLAKRIRFVVIEEEQALRVDSLEFIESVNCELILTLSDKDSGICRDASGAFTCRLTRQGYLRILELLDPFTNEEVTGFQWLYDLPNGPTELLLSRDGKW